MTMSGDPAENDDRSTAEIAENAEIPYRGVTMACAYRMDLVVENQVVVEVKSVERLDRVHEAQMLSYLRLSGCHVGLLLNFNVKWLTATGIKRLVHDFPEE